MVSTGWMPGVGHEPVVNHSGSMDGDIGLILHVCEGNGDQFKWFNNPNADASSHFWVGKNGDIEQYVPLGTKAWAQANGNGTYASVETEGFTNEPLTDAQLNSIARIYAWGGWPRELAEVPGQAGFGWHGMGGASWGGHFGCPGDIRRGQRQEILNRAGGAVAPPPAPTPAPTPPNNGLGILPLAVDGDFGVNTIAATQRATGATPDGVWGPLSRQALQRHLGVAADGVVGPVTVRALQVHVGCVADGIWGSDTTRHLQTCLNARRF